MVTKAVCQSWIDWCLAGRWTSEAKKQKIQNAKKRQKMLYLQRTLENFLVFLTTVSCCYNGYSKTWTDARDACRTVSANSNLVSIHSLAENAFVANLFNGSLFAAWIGLSDRGVLFGRLFWFFFVNVRATNRLKTYSVSRMLIIFIWDDCKKAVFLVSVTVWRWQFLVYDESLNFRSYKENKIG